ncbi:hypothetical protein [Fluviicola sp.]|uniref:hypothetical protein n=1 Tax=Fluviicola sp. TaxID=1917219 RepID=UPI0031D3E304
MSIKMTFISLFITVNLQTFGQDCKCTELLQDGLYSFTKMTRTDSFSKDLRTYYLSETFKSDMRSGKWGGSLTIPIKGIPFSIGMNDSEEKFSELRTKLLEISELSIDEGSVQASFGSIPNTSLYDAFVECTRICVNPGSGFIQGKNLETEDAVVFTIYYRPSSPSDPMPVVKNFSVLPEGSVISGNVSVNQPLESFTTLITCKRPLDKDLILTLQTDRGAISSKAYALENISSNKELPIGTIVISYLNFEQFNAATKNNEKSPGGIWTSNKSKWAPCDGRPIPNSKFQTLTSQSQIPDLRGMFLRGLNTFDPNQPVPPVSANKADPDARIVGSYQSDELKSHKHTFSYLKPKQNDSKGASGNHKVSDTDVTNTGKTNATGGAETRPRNIAVYYYIKIN